MRTSCAVPGDSRGRRLIAKVGRSSVVKNWVRQPPPFGELRGQSETTLDDKRLNMVGGNQPEISAPAYGSNLRRPLPKSVTRQSSGCISTFMMSS